MREGTKNVDSFNVFNTFICQSADMDVKINEKDKEMTLLCVLPKSWNHPVTSISFSTTNSLDHDSIFRVLLFEEV